METTLVKIRDFNEPSPATWDALVKQGSTPKACSINTRGVFVLYEVPSIATDETQHDKFIVIPPGNKIPDGAVFFELLDLSYEVNGEYKVVIFPLYRLKY